MIALAEYKRIIDGLAGASTIKLATAKWNVSEDGALRAYQKGDFILGHFAKGGIASISDDRHVLIVGGTRGGKGVSLIVPNIISWQGSTVVIDPKGENAILTARRRARGNEYTAGFHQPVRILDPFGEVRNGEDDFEDLRASFNPLDFISGDREESIDEAARIAESLTVREGTSDPFWVDAQLEYMQMVILHVATAPEIAAADRNLLTVRELLTVGDTKAAEKAAAFIKKGKAPSGFNMLFAAMKRNQAFGGLIAQAGHKFDNLERTSPRLFNSVVTVASTNTDFLKSPGIKRCVQKSTFSLEELKTSERGSNLFICLPQRYMHTHYRWLRMMVTMVVTEMERVKRKPLCGFPVLMILDEFPALKRMAVIENAAAQIAGFGVKLVFVAQTLVQLKDQYRDNWETLVANAGVKLLFSIDDEFSQSYTSKLIGEHEVSRYTRSFSETEGHSISQTRGMSFGQSNNSSFSVSGNGSSSSFGSGTNFSKSSSNSHSQSSSRTQGYSETLHKRPLITGDELGRAFSNRYNKVLALISGQHPTILERCRYHKDEFFWGFFDRHPDHPPPMTRAEIVTFKEKRAQKQGAEKERERLEKERNAEQARILALRLEDERRRQEEAKRLQKKRYHKVNCIVLAVVTPVVLGVAYLVMSSIVRSVLTTNWSRILMQ